MNQVSQEELIIRRYLLGLTTTEESLDVEERLLTVDTFYRELLIAEDELVDDYLSGQLSQPERLSFETHFLQAPERRQKLRFAGALRRFVAENAAFESFSSAEASATKLPTRKFFSLLPFRNPAVSYALVAAILLIIGGISWSLFNNWRQQATQQSGTVLAVVLTPGLSRDGGETKRVAISPATGTIRLQLQAANTEYASYRAVVRSSDRSEVWSQTNLPARDQSGARVVTADVPATSLSAGDYQIRLSGQLPNGAFEDVATYQLRVTR